MFDFAGRLLFPLVLFVAGILLFYMRKQATFFFGLYFAWSLQKFFLSSSAGLKPIELAVAAVTLLYAIRLSRTGRLD